MDEAVRIYQPTNSKNANVKPEIEIVKKTKAVHAKKKSKWKFDPDCMKKVIAEHAKEVHELNEKYPVAEVLYNWLLAILIVCLFVSFIVWGVNIHTERQAEAFAATALADYQAEQEAIESARQAEIAAAARSEEAIMKNEATEAAKAIYGIRNFIEKYDYSEADLKTYVRCMIDRVDFSNGVNNFTNVVSQESQFLGYSSSNPVLSEYYEVAYEEINTWHHETSKPWDSSYRFAELMPDGVWLSNEFGANGYVRRVQY